MLLEMGLIAAGIPMGWLLRRSPAAQRATGRVLTAAIWLLLFLLGFALGGDEVLVARFQELGVQAAVISIFGLAGSLVAAWLLGRFFSLEHGPRPAAGRGEPDAPAAADAARAPTFHEADHIPGGEGNG